MKKVKIAEHDVNVLTKEELIALGFREVGDTMRKEYPTGSPTGHEVGIAVFHEIQWNSGVYSYNAANEILSIFYYKRSWDAGEFLDRVAKAVSEYRADMDKLGIPEVPEGGKE